MWRHKSASYPVALAVMKTSLILLLLVAVAQCRSDYVVDLTYTGYISRWDDADDLLDRWGEVTNPEEDEFALWNTRHVVEDSVQEVEDGVFKVDEIDPVNPDVTMHGQFFDFQQQDNCVTFNCLYQLEHTFHSDISLCIDIDEANGKFTTKWFEHPCNQPEDENYGAETVEACKTVSTLYAEYGLALITTYVEGFKLDAAVHAAMRVEDRLIEYGVGN